MAFRSSDRRRGQALEHFWARNKVVGAICHGAIALGNIPDRVRGRRVTGYTLEGDKELQRLFESGFLIPHFPQTVLEEAGAAYSRVAPNDPYVIVDGQLVTGQNQQSASEYALQLFHRMTGESPVTGSVSARRSCSSRASGFISGVSPASGRTSAFSASRARANFTRFSGRRRSFLSWRSR